MLIVFFNTLLCATAT
jgi:hypothetical protein